MQIDREDRVRMERAHVRAWPALRSENIEGWLWRSSGGASQRANSVSTIDFSGTAPEAAIGEAEARYRSAGQSPRFHTFDETSPPDLPDLLRKRGYRETEGTITMFKRIENTAASPAVECRDDPWTEWQDVYLGEITEDRRLANALILDRIPSPRAFFGYRIDNQIVATALCVGGFGCAVIECVATRRDARRRGAARSLLPALEAWAYQQSAGCLGLQVASGNAAAVALYDRLGFVAGAANTFWVK